MVGGRRAGEGLILPRRCEEELEVQHLYMVCAELVGDRNRLVDRQLLLDVPPRVMDQRVENGRTILFHPIQQSLARIHRHRHALPEELILYEDRGRSWGLVEDAVCPVMRRVEGTGLSASRRDQAHNADYRENCAEQ